MRRIAHAAGWAVIRAFGRRVECPVCQEGEAARAIGDRFVCPDTGVELLSLAEARRCAENWRAWLETRSQR